jgi:hypothetical protein
MFARVLLSAGALAAACATGPEPRIEETPLSGPASAAAGGGLAETAETPRPAPPAFLSRRDLLRVLDRGPRDFLSSIDEDPGVDGGRFRGWIFRGWRDPRFAAADLLPGDLILRVNGQPIEKPEQFMAVWETLRSANELVIDTERDGKARVVRYPIRD